ncbi:MAG: hypothetical protein OXI70_00915 [Chloroflexota bacterium]|nr:hypothetical protein [Chloroflexota bacterium]
MYQYGSYDPAVHGEDRGSYADPKIVKNISGIFKASKEAWEHEKEAREHEKEAREKALIEAKIGVIREGLEAFKPDPIELGTELFDSVRLGTTSISRRREQFGGSEGDLLQDLMEFPILSNVLSRASKVLPKPVRTSLSKWGEGLAYHREAAIETRRNFLDSSAFLKATGYLNADGSVNMSELSAWLDTSAQAEQADKARSESTQAQTEATQHGTAVIQTEIPLLHERRAALAGGSDQTRIATEAETAFTAARAQSVATQQAMVDGFMRSLTEQDARLTGGSRNTNSAAPGPSETSGSPTDSVAEERARFLAADPPPNLQEIYRDQLEQDHDMSGFLNAEHWWEKHKEHVAKLKYGYAQGTAFAPGGLALVGEMGPELVNLPRGSQVIPNPRLGGDVHVYVNVEGSVVAERDLAQRLRQELIRTSRRTVDLGFN